MSSWSRIPVVISNRVTVPAKVRYKYNKILLNGVIFELRTWAFKITHIKEYGIVQTCSTLSCTPSFLDGVVLIWNRELFHKCTGLSDLRNLINSSFHPVQPFLPVYVHM